jgi:translation elongation factor P/translation initiation factor 5A
LLKLIELIRRPAQSTTPAVPPTSAGSLRAGDIVRTAKRSYRVVSTSFGDDARRAGRVVADTVDLVTGRLRVLDFPSADTMVTVETA